MSTPPYRILSHRDADFTTVQRMVRFARYWDLVGNSGRFPHTLELLLDTQAFANFLALSDWLHDTTGQTHRIALQRWFELLRIFLIEQKQLDEQNIDAALLADYRHNGLKGLPEFARPHARGKASGKQERNSACLHENGGPKLPGNGEVSTADSQVARTSSATPARQTRHL